jgi:hypothetical protein
VFEYNVFGIVPVNDHLMQNAAQRLVMQAKTQTGKKHYERLTAEIVAYLNSVILVAVKADTTIFGNSI